MGESVAIADIFSQAPETDTQDGESKTVAIADVTEAADPAPTGIPSTPDEHQGEFLSKVGDAIYNGALNFSLRYAGGVVGATATVNDWIGSALPPNPMSGFVAPENVTLPAYRKLFVEQGQAQEKAARALAPGENTFEKAMYGFAESLGSMPPIIASEVMAGRALQTAMTGMILPAMEAALAKVPDFVLGTGWRGLVEGFNTSGNVAERTMAGVGKAAENMSWGMLFTHAGLNDEQRMTLQKAILTGHEGLADQVLKTSSRWMIGKMSAIGLAQSFYNASKEGRLPTADEMIESTTQGGMMGFLFSAIPQFAEASKVAEGRRALQVYTRKIAALAPTGEKWYHGGAKGLEGDLVAGMVTRDYGEAKRYATEKGGAVYEVPSDAVVPATAKDTGADGQSLAPNYQNYGFVKGVAAGEKGWAAKVANEPGTLDPAAVKQVLVDLVSDPKVPKGVRNAVSEVALQILRERGAVMPPEFDAGKWKDASPISRLTQTMERTLEQMDPKGAKETQAFLTQMVKENETLGSDWLRKWVNWVREKPMGELGIKPRSEQDKVLFDYAEGKATSEQLKTAFPDNWERASAVVTEGKARYKQALDEWNQTRAEYRLPPVPERADYVRHMRELRTTTDMLGWFFSDKTPTEAAAIVERRLGRPMSSAEKAREGDTAERSYVLSMQDYGEVVKNARFHLDSVQRGRRLERYIRAQAEANATAVDANGKPAPKIDLQNFMSQITQYTNYMAGQPSRLTNAVTEDILGRTGFAVIRYLQQSPVVNMVSGNASMLLMNALTAPQLMAYGIYHPDSIGKGLTTALLYSRPSNRNTPLEIEGQISGFSTRRLGFDKIPKDWVENMADKGMGFAKLSDHFMLNTVISSRYWEYRSKGLLPKDAMAKADDEAVRIIGDRSLGQQPLLFTEPALKAFTALQFEINNQWSNLTHDLPQMYKGQSAKLFGAYAAYALTANMMNTVLEKTIGRRPGFDPLYILSTVLGSTWFGAGKDNDMRPFAERFDDAQSNLLGNTPFMQLVATKGGRFPISAAFPDLAVMKEGMGKVAEKSYSSFPVSAAFMNYGTREEMPTRAMGDLVRTALYLNPAGWGGQVKKTWQGVGTWLKGYDETPGGKVRYTVDQNLGSFMQMFLFGKNASPQAVEYWKSPQSERN